MHNFCRFSLGSVFVFLVVFFLFSAAAGALAVPAAADFSFLVFGDNRDGDDIYRDLIQKVNAEKNIAFAVHVGDFVALGKESEYKKYRQMESGLQHKIYHVMGNHDAVYGGWRRFNQYFGPAYYSFDFQDSHFVVIDNSFDRRLTKTQIDWLAKDLAAARAENIFVFLHRPLFDPSGLFGNSVMESKAKASRLQALFEKYKVKAVFAGHIHGFAQTQLNGVDYIITGGAGAPLYLPQQMGGYYHYVRVAVCGGRVDYAVKRVYD